MSEYSKVIGYKLNVQKSNVFLYTSNEQLKFEIKKITMAPETKMLRYKSDKIYIIRCICGKLQN